MIAEVVFVVMVAAVAAVVCGHQGEPFPVLRWWRAARGSRWARRLLYGRLPASAPLRAVREHPESRRAADGRVTRRETSEAPSSAPSCRQTAPQKSSEGFPAPGAPSRSRKRTAPHAPTWAQPDEEAA